MSKFVSVPTEIEAVQFDGDFNTLRQDMVNTWPGTGTERRVRRTIDADSLDKVVVQIWVEANSEWLTIEPSEWVIRDRIGLYPCKDEIFREKYRPMDEEADETFEENAPPTVETDDEFDAVLKESTLREELATLLNRLSRENESGTADFVLAHFLIGSLETFEESIKMRAGARSERWQYDIPSPTAKEIGE